MTEDQKRQETEKRVALAVEQTLAQDPAMFVFPVFSAGYSRGGMTKREFLAGISMMGLMDAECLLDAADVANMAVRYADALIAKLSEGQS